MPDRPPVSGEPRTLPLDVLFARAIADQPEYADGFGYCDFCQYAKHEGNGHAPDCVYPLARRLVEASTGAALDVERLAKALSSVTGDGLVLTVDRIQARKVAAEYARLAEQSDV